MNKILKHINIICISVLVTTSCVGLYGFMELEDVRVGHDGIDRLTLVHRQVERYTSEEFHYYMERFDTVDAIDYIKYLDGYNILHEVIEGEAEIEEFDNYMQEQKDIILGKENRLPTIKNAWLLLSVISAVLSMLCIFMYKRNKKEVKGR